MSAPPAAVVIAVSVNGEHTFSKANQPAIRLIAGRGVEGDAHFGATVQHLHDKGRDPERVNLRQVHLMHQELFDELRGHGFAVSPGDLGENVTTRGIDLLHLPAGTRLHLGTDAVIEITGLRTPCFQIDRFQKGLLRAAWQRDDGQKPFPKTGIMSVVVTGGEIRVGDAIRVELPPEPHQALQPV